MRKWWWLGLFAIVAMPQAFAAAQDGEKKPDAEKKAADDKAEAAKKAAAEKAAATRARQAASQAATKEIREVQEFLQKKDFEGAEKLVSETLEKNANWPYKTSAHSMLAQAYMDAGNKVKAGEHALVLVENQLEIAKRNPAMLGNVAPLLTRFGAALKDAGKFDGLVAEIEKTADSAAENKERRIGALAGKMRVFKAIGRTSDVDKIVSDIDGETKESLKTDPKNAKGLVARIEALDLLVEHFTANKEKRAEFVKEQAELIKNGMTEFPKEVAIATRHFNQKLTKIVRLGAEKAKEVEEQYAAIQKEVKEYVDALPDASNGRSLTAMVTNFERSLTYIRAHAPLIGQPAIPMEGEVNAWVNGSTLTDADLKDKVVLIDFWAVWCGPCIATFPHLNEWREKYGDKGFVIVGATKYYNDDWDEAAKRSKRINKEERVLTPEEEQAAMVKFAEHHKLKHVFAVQKDDSKLDDFYKVTGIPQAVLIDKNGKVKLIRVGSGPDNAHDLEAGIRECLGLPAEETH